MYQYKSFFVCARLIVILRENYTRCTVCSLVFDIELYMFTND